MYSGEKAIGTGARKITPGNILELRYWKEFKTTGARRKMKNTLNIVGSICDGFRRRDEDWQV
ncbi:MAG: hypothetical protein NC937_06900 [Candidatus Omnitrophica bacterium]|nr:hypothetical protein [Candidatus Omnitrophota bacterium]